MLLLLFPVHIFYDCYKFFGKMNIEHQTAEIESSKIVTQEKFIILCTSHSDGSGYLKLGFGVLVVSTCRGRIISIFLPYLLIF